MTGSIEYVNHLGEKAVLKGGAVHADSGSLHDWSLDAELVCGRIFGFKRSQVERKVSFVITAPSVSTGLMLRNRIYEIVEADVAARVAGRLYVDGWYVECFVRSAVKDAYWMDGRAAHYELVTVSDDALWRRESTVQFVPDTSVRDYPYLDFPIGFPFDPTPNRVSKSVSNPSRTPSGFRLVVYGPAVDPYVIIGRNRYQVETSVPDGGILTVDSTAKTCVVKDVGGTEANVFSRRIKGAPGSGSYAFEPVPAGQSDVSWDNSFGFDLTLIETRLEPSWS